MNRPFRGFRHIALILLVFTARCAKIGEDIIITDPLFDIMELKPKIKLSGSGNCFCVDDEERLYFVEMEKHRILKFDNKGNFIAQIGRMGQDPPGLFYPNGIDFQDNKLYVANSSGKEVKIFTTQGDFISYFKVDAARRSFSISIGPGVIFLDTKTREISNFDRKKLISCYSEEGEYLRGIGSCIPCSNWRKYLVFNSIFLQARGAELWGACKFLPILFAYKQTGEEILNLDLSKSGLNEIQAIEKRIEAEGFDIPMSHSGDNPDGVKSVIFCTGFGVDTNGDLFYALNDYSHEPVRGCVFRFNRKGKLKTKLYFKLKDRFCRLQGLLIKSADQKYAVGSIGNKSRFLYKF